MTALQQQPPSITIGTDQIALCSRTFERALDMCDNIEDFKVKEVMIVLINCKTQQSFEISMSRDCE